MKPLLLPQPYSTWAEQDWPNDPRLFNMGFNFDIMSDFYGNDFRIASP